MREGGEGREGEREMKRTMKARNEEMITKSPPFFSQPSLLHLVSSLLYSIPSFSFAERSKERGDERDERARHGREEKSESEKEREREREKQKRDNVRVKEKRETRREELTSSFCPSFVLPFSLKEEGEKNGQEKKDQSKEGERERRENEEFTSSTSMPIPLS